MTEELKEAGLKAVSYHGQRSDADREHAHSMWAKNRVDIVVSTVAFGMGINKLNVRNATSIPFHSVLYLS